MYEVRGVTISCRGQFSHRCEPVDEASTDGTCFQHPIEVTERLTFYYGLTKAVRRTSSSEEGAAPILMCRLFNVAPSSSTIAGIAEVGEWGGGG